MRKKLLAVGIGAALLLSATIGLSQDVKTPAVTGSKPAPAQSMPAMEQMDEHMNKMQALHDKMMSAATPEERQKAMDAARMEMQECMTMMQGMMQGGGMMGGGGGMMDQQGMMGPSKASEPAPKKGS